ncbi:MAG: hypothetical protein IPN78_13050, partial [Candidatus Accumulibacter sp.]|nr:hypothetical protein [Candidatus Accumulibacter propinquus]
MFGVEPMRDSDSHFTIRVAQPGAMAAAVGAGRERDDAAHDFIGVGGGRRHCRQRRAERAAIARRSETIIQPACRFLRATPKKRSMRCPL